MARRDSLFNDPTPSLGEALPERTIDRIAERVAERLSERLASLRPAETPHLLTIKEAAAVLGCHPNTVRNLLDLGDLVPTWVTDRAPRIAVSQIEHFVRTRTGSR